MDGRTILLRLDILLNHDWKKVYNYIDTKNKDVLHKEFDLEYETKLYALLSEGWKILTMLDDEYPMYLKTQVKYPPFVVYYKCTLEEIEDKFKALNNYNPSEGCFLE